MSVDVLGGITRPVALDTQIAARTLIRLDNGNVLFENAFYSVVVSPMGTVTVSNRGSGNSYDFSPNLFVNVDGHREFRFVGDLEVGFSNELRLVFDTVPSANDQYIGVLDALYIEDGGGYSARISGMNEVGGQGLVFEENIEPNDIGQNGFVPPDAVVSISESQTGGGFVATDANGNQVLVGQQYINQNDAQRIAQLIEFGRRVYQSFGNSFAVSLLSQSYSTIFSSALEQMAQVDTNMEAIARCRQALERVPSGVRFLA